VGPVADAPTRGRGLVNVTYDAPRSRDLQTLDVHAQAVEWPRYTC
jgi:hypothetical protein